MVQVNTNDVIVIGAGLAGLAAANKVAEAGCKVSVLEKSAEALYLCNSRYTGGLFHIAMDDMAGEPDWVRANLEHVTRGTTDAALASALTRNARRTLKWLSSLGVRFIQAGPDGLRRNSLSPPGVRQTGLNWRGRAGDVMLRTLEERLLSQGGQIVRGMAVTQLDMEDGRCVGVRAHDVQGQAQTWSARSVVIADGGFQANPDLLRRFISSHPERLLQRNAQSGQGAGLTMAESVGAQLVGTDRFYGHIQHRKAMTDGALWPYPVLDSLATAGLVVDGTGQRFCDEGLGGVFVTNAIARLPDPLSAVIIFDDATWNGPGRDWLLPANPYLLSAGGDLISAPTLPALAQKLGLPDTLMDTVAHYNQCIENGGAGHQPPRTSSPYKAWPVLQGPFHAVEACAGITYTMGGIATDAQGHVLDTQAQVIPGLFAAGACTGGLEGGGEAAGYSGGLSKSAVFGMLAGEAIVTELALQGA